MANRDWNGYQPWNRKDSYDHAMIIPHGSGQSRFYNMTTTSPYPSATFAPRHIVHHQENMVCVNANNIISQQHDKNQCLYFVPVTQSDGSPTQITEEPITTTNTSNITDNDNESIKDKYKKSHKMLVQIYLVV